MAGDEGDEELIDWLRILDFAGTGTSSVRAPPKQQLPPILYPLFWTGTHGQEVDEALDPGPGKEAEVQVKRQGPVPSQFQAHFLGLTTCMSSETWLVKLSFEISKDVQPPPPQGYDGWLLVLDRIPPPLPVSEAGGSSIFLPN